MLREVPEPGPRRGATAELRPQTGGGEHSCLPRSRRESEKEAETETRMDAGAREARMIEN